MFLSSFLEARSQSQELHLELCLSFDFLLFFFDLFTSSTAVTNNVIMSDNDYEATIKTLVEWVIIIQIMTYPFHR